MDVVVPVVEVVAEELDVLVVVLVRVVVDTELVEVAVLDVVLDDVEVVVLVVFEVVECFPRTVLVQGPATRPGRLLVVLDGDATPVSLRKVDGL